MTRSVKYPVAGRSVVVTGAASGIGRALAQRFSAYGSAVAIVDVDERGLRETESSLSGPVLSQVLDVRDAQAQIDFAAKVADWAPTPLGAVFNNAGVAVSSRVVNSVPADDQWLWDINFHGVVNGTRAFLPLLVAQDSGSIVNTSSVFGLMAVPTQSAYAAAKFAVRGYTEALRQELWGTGVRAVVVHPGGIDTNIVRNSRVHDDPAGRGRTKEDMVREFAAVTMTKPDKAAEIIHRGVERGKARILVGPDAYLFDALARGAPTHGYGLMVKLQKRLRGLSRAKAGNRVAAVD